MKVDLGVLRGLDVKEDSGSYAVFTEQEIVSITKFSGEGRSTHFASAGDLRTETYLFQYLPAVRQKRDHWSNPVTGEGNEERRRSKSYRHTSVVMPKPGVVPRNQALVFCLVLFPIECPTPCCPLPVFRQFIFVCMRTSQTSFGSKVKMSNVNSAGVQCAALWEVFCPARGPPLPMKLESIFRIFFEALNLAVIDTIMGHVNVHIDCDLISCYASLYRAGGEPTFAADVFQSASRKRRNYGDVAAHHSTQNTQHHTNTYQHQQLTHKQSNAPQNRSRASRSMEEGGQDARLAGCTRHSAASNVPAREGRVESPQPSVVHVEANKLGEPRSCCPGALALVHLQEAFLNA